MRVCVDVAGGCWIPGGPVLALLSNLSINVTHTYIHTRTASFWDKRIKEIKKKKSLTNQTWEWRNFPSWLKHLALINRYHTHTLTPYPSQPGRSTNKRINKTWTLQPVRAIFLCWKMLRVQDVSAFFVHTRILLPIAQDICFTEAIIYPIVSI